MCDICLVVFQENIVFPNIFTSIKGAIQKVKEKDKQLKQQTTRTQTLKLLKGPKRPQKVVALMANIDRGLRKWILRQIVTAELNFIFVFFFFFFLSSQVGRKVPHSQRDKFPPTFFSLWGLSLQLPGNYQCHRKIQKVWKNGKRRGHQQETATFYLLNYFDKRIKSGIEKKTHDQANFSFLIYQLP